METQKKISKEMVDLENDGTKGEVGNKPEEDEESNTEEGFVIEQATKGMAVYRDYKNLSANTKLKRLIR